MPTGEVDATSGLPVYKIGNSYVTLNGGNEPVPSPFGPSPVSDGGFQAQATADMGLQGNKANYTASNGTVVQPDAVDWTPGGAGVVEMKNINGTLYPSSQITGEIQLSKDLGLPYTLVVSPNTVVSPSLLQQVQATGGSIKVFNQATGVQVPYITSGP